MSTAKPSPLPPVFPLGALDPDVHEEAPPLEEPIVLYMLAAKNDASQPGDGGQVVLALIQQTRYSAGVVRLEGGRVEPVVIDARLPMSCHADSFLAKFPWKGRKALEQRIFKVSVQEIAESDLPPDFDPSWYEEPKTSIGPVVDPQTAEDSLARAYAQAVSQGNTALAQQIHALLAAQDAPAATE